MTPTSKAAQAMTDNFNGDNDKLIASINALLALDAECALVPHGIGGHARTLLAASVSRLAAHSQAQAAEAVADEPLLQSYFEYVREAYRNGNRQMYTLYEWQKHPSAPAASPVASEREGLTREQREAITECIEYLTPAAKAFAEIDMGDSKHARCIRTLRAILATRTGSDT